MVQSPSPARAAATRRAARAALLALALALLCSLAAGAARPADAAAARRGAASQCLTVGFRSYASAPAGGMNVLYPRGNRATARYARSIAKEVRTRIFPRFKKVLGRTPPGDARERCPNGPNGKVDIVVTGARRFGPWRPTRAAAGFASPYSLDSCAPGRAVFIVVRPGTRRFVVAHEVFHAFQAAFPTRDRCEDYLGWSEATANWGAEHVYPRDQDEHRHRTGIEVTDFPMIGGYSDWVFPRYLSERYGPGAVRRLEEGKARWGWDEFVDRSIPGGLVDRYPEFAALAWNQDPLPKVAGLGTSFKQWDRFAARPRRVQRSDIRLDGARTATIPAPTGEIRVISRAYRRVVVSDPAVRHITFRNPDASNVDFHVRAMIRLADGSWRHEEWDGRESVEFCREDPAQDVQEIVLVYANSHYKTNKRVNAETRFVAEDSCALRYRILGASFRTVSTGTASDMLCGTQSGSIVFEGTAGEQAWDPARNLVERRFDRADGRIYADVPARWHSHHLEGCRFSEEPRGRCVRDMPDRTPTPGGTWPTGISVNGGWNDEQWEVVWSLDNPSIGFFDAGDDECNVNIWGSFAYERQKVREPRGTFLRTEPFTLTFSGSGRPESVTPRDADLTQTWTYELTLRRVDAEGRPLA